MIDKSYYKVKEIIKHTSLTKEIVSFSLFGSTNSHYCEGLNQNILEWEKSNPNVSFAIFSSKTIFDNFKNSIKAKRFWVYIMDDDDSKYYPTLWRYLIIQKLCLFKSVIIHFRDLDSRPINRELKIIDNFKKSKFNYLIIRDHPLQNSEIMAGLFSLKYNFRTRFIFKRFFNTSDSDFYGVDQVLLNKQVYPLIVNDSYIFDPFNHFDELNRVDLILERDNFEFCGECYLKGNKIDDSINGRKYLENYLRKINK